MNFSGQEVWKQKQTKHESMCQKRDHEPDMTSLGEHKKNMYASIAWTITNQTFLHNSVVIDASRWLQDRPILFAWNYTIGLYNYGPVLGYIIMDLVSSFCLQFLPFKQSAQISVQIRWNKIIQWIDIHIFDENFKYYIFPFGEGGKEKGTEQQR